MTESRLYSLLQQFASEHSTAIGGNIRVEITPGSVRFVPKSGFSGMKYEDTEFLSEQIRGAKAFLYWLWRQKGK
jgi:hypothetical protein